MAQRLNCLKVINFIENSPEFQTHIIYCKKILIAYSGGKDSSSLLAIFYILSQKYKFKLGVVYCNHRWTKTTDATLLVFNIIEKYKLPVYYVDTDPRVIQKPENIARQWRYNAFQQIIIKGKYDILITGHTLSDKAETLLFNLSRGCGLKGICALNTIQYFKNLTSDSSLTKFDFKHQVLELKNMTDYVEKFRQTKKSKIARRASLNEEKLAELTLNTFFFKKKAFVKPQALGTTHVFLENEKCTENLHQARNQVQSFDIFNFIFSYYLLNCYFKKISCTWSPYKNIKRNNSSNKKIKLNSKAYFSFITLVNPATYLTAKKVYDVFEFKQKKDLNFLTQTPLYKKKSHQQIKLVQTLKNKNFLFLDSFVICLQKQQRKNRLHVTSNYYNREIKYLLLKKKSEKKSSNRFIKYSKSDTALFFKVKNTQTYKQHRIISQKNNRTSVLIIRPLLQLDQSTIKLFVKQLQLPIYIDPSNFDTSLTRNFIRNKIIPLLQEINPKAEQNLYKFSQIAKLYYDLYGERFCSSNKLSLFKP